MSQPDHIHCEITPGTTANVAHNVSAEREATRIRNIAADLRREMGTAIASGQPHPTERDKTL